jgi:hypothetical protein
VPRLDRQGLPAQGPGGTGFLGGSSAVAWSGRKNGYGCGPITDPTRRFEYDYDTVLRRLGRARNRRFPRVGLEKGQGFPELTPRAALVLIIPWSCVRITPGLFACVPVFQGRTLLGRRHRDTPVRGTTRRSVRRAAQRRLSMGLKRRPGHCQEPKGGRSSGSRPCTLYQDRLDREAAAWLGSPFLRARRALPYRGQNGEV